MESCYVNLIIGLVSFFAAVLVYIKFIYKQQQSFTPSDLPGSKSQPISLAAKMEPNVYETEDTRIFYPLQPPVNPNIRKARKLNKISSDSDLYNNQDYSSPEYLLNVPGVETNQLIYSGGKAKMLQIPLQFNEPYNEQLRSQEILITPYNCVKYGS
jgi:hypothetical protein